MNIKNYIVLTDEQKTIKHIISILESLNRRFVICKNDGDNGFTINGKTSGEIMSCIITQVIPKLEGTLSYKFFIDNVLPSMKISTGYNGDFHGVYICFPNLRTIPLEFQIDKYYEGQLTKRYLKSITINNVEKTKETYGFIHESPTPTVYGFDTKEEAIKALRYL